MTTATGQRAIAQRYGGIEVLLDERTGLPAGLAASAGATPIPFRVAVEVESGGEEVPGTMGGLRYRDTERHWAAELVPGSIERVRSGPRETHRLLIDAGAWRVRSEITLRPEHPRVELRLAVSPSAGREALVRDLHLTAELGLEDRDAWRVEAPGNMMRPGVRAAEIAEPVPVQSVGHHLGSPGMVAVHRPERPLSLIVWPFSRSEDDLITLEPGDAGLLLQISTQLAGAVASGEWLEHGPIYLDAVDAGWDELRARVRDWYPSMGLTTPADRPGWAAAANIFEVMVGVAPFRGGYSYSPYPTLRDLIDDLDRIAELGVDCVQLMPRHPYPSYNIHEPGDVAITYGDPAEVRELVEGCHARGMRLILDILLHGVIDKQVMRQTVDLVRNGPHAERLDDPCTDVYAGASEEISWARHIIEFAPYWEEGAPERHPLLVAHPDWFMRDAAGAVAGVYTRALDTANPEWQDHFVDACAALVDNYGIDGFRVDAPLYNRFANWSESTRRRAGYALGALELLRKLRLALRERSQELLLYSEPSGPLVRESLDLTYSYEETWLVPSLFGTDGPADTEWRRVRSGRELMQWFSDFDAALPVGSLSAHFIDAHDTIWWRLPGDLWRRDQIGLPAAKAMLAIYALRGGAYMTFVGGERELESELRLAHELRRRLPEIRLGAVDYDAVSVADDAVYAVLRTSADHAAIVAVNTSAAPVRTPCEVRVDPALGPQDSGEVLDAWADEWLRAARAANGSVHLDLALAPYQVRVLRLTP